MSTSATSPTAKSVGRVFAWVLAAVLILLVAAAAWVGVRAVLAYGHLRDAQTAASALSASLADPAAVATGIPALTDDTAAAHALTDDPVWNAVEVLPWIGPQMSAVATVAAAVDEVAQSALTPLAEAAAALPPDATRVQDGRIDVTVFTAVQDAASTGAAAIGRAANSVGAIDIPPLVGPVRTAVEEVGTLLDETEATASALARTSRLLPAMLGADGPRDYLVLFQNNAEWRSLGGIPGAMALVHADQGGISLVAQGEASEFPRYDEPVLALDPEVEAIFGTHPGRWMHNVTQSPDFALSGALAREMWVRERGGSLDGVIAIDPVALSYLLAATGPVTLDTGEVLTAENAVPLLLNEVYIRYPDYHDQDAFFASAAVGIFDALSRGGANPTALLDAFARAGDESRLLLWSAHEDEQALLAETTLAGGLPESDAEESRFGLYLNDGTGSKMDYYVRSDVSVVWDDCTSDASGAVSGTATLTATLTNEAPGDGSLPTYITGGGSYGVTPGVARTVGYAYLPTGFELLDATITGDTGFGGGYHEGRRVLRFSSDLAPGESSTVTVTARSVQPGASTVAVRATPTITSAGEIVSQCEVAYDQGDRSGDSAANDSERDLAAPKASFTG
ncbi:DUF4012 domain-containing protein [Microbacterium allomyrinae]|uniref:DUF4012 domain-containing protein n=1 Tax=Microbacterium allomyrinae TaxID=2830666 RepID=A0A9X1S5L5_9MICO|nr:DUF4012 domain-containing protein [Microbacterium allomyrinae]MCC2034035.1 DUF4012 domain-containing protein [Microbacterium allomyrinae]